MRDRRDETRVGLGSPAQARTDLNSPANDVAGLALVSNLPSPTPVTEIKSLIGDGTKLYHQLVGGVLTRRRSLDELMAVARAELKTNPTITVYTFTGGVEYRRAANPWAGLTAAIKDMADDFARFAETFRRSSVAPRPPLRLIPGGRGTGPP